MFLRLLLFAVIGITARMPAADAAPKSAQPQIHDLGGGIFQVGGVKLNKNARTVTFPAAVQMNEGLVEYLLVSRTGKTHESLLVTDVEPLHVHTAMLLLGVRASPESRGEINGGGQLDAAALAHAPALKGENVFIGLKWKTEAAEMRVPAEDLMVNDKTKRNVTRGPWTYNGSGFYGGGKFAAQIEGSFVAMITDSTALINNPRTGHVNDSIWLADPAKVPKKGTPVEITITLEGAKP